MPQPDKYRNFAELQQGEVHGRDYQVRSILRLGMPAVLAPHGGGIEPGTSEIAEAIAGSDLSFYAFEGVKPAGGNIDLHLTSTRFDEPQGVKLVASSPKVVTIHGQGDDKQIVYIGGRDEQLLRLMRDALGEYGFRTEWHESPTLHGTAVTNICNRGASGMGVQFELSRGVRRLLFESLSKEGRAKKRPHFHAFVTAVRRVLL